MKGNLPLTRQILRQSDKLPTAEEVSKAKCEAISELGTAIQTSSFKLAWSYPSSFSRDNLTKCEFQDAIAIRYKKHIKNRPSKCPCGSTFNLTHALNCHRGGFVNDRHDNIRNLECSLLKTIVQDVECEPQLQPVVNTR